MEYIYEWRIASEKASDNEFSCLSYNQANFYSPSLFAHYVRAAPIYHATHAQTQ